MSSFFSTCYKKCFFSPSSQLCSLATSLLVYIVAFASILSASQNALAQTNAGALVPVLDLIINDDANGPPTTQTGNFRIATRKLYQVSAPAGLQRTDTYSYSNAGLVTTIFGSQTQPVSGTQTITNNYNSDSNPSTVTFTGTGALNEQQTDTFVYGPGVPLTRVNTTVSPTATNNVYTPSYSNGRLTSASLVISSSGSNSTEQHTFGYNAAGLISSQAIVRSGALPNANITYVYNAQGFLISSVKIEGTQTATSTFEWQTNSKHVQHLEFSFNGGSPLRVRIESDYVSGPCKILNANSPEMILSVIQTGPPVSTGVDCGNE